MKRRSFALSALLLPFSWLRFREKSKVDGPSQEELAAMAAEGDCSIVWEDKRKGIIRSVTPRKGQANTSKLTAAQIFGVAHEAGVEFHIDWYRNGHGYPAVRLKHYRHYPGCHGIGVNAIRSCDPKPYFGRSLAGCSYDAVLQELAEQLIRFMSKDEKKAFEAVLAKSGGRYARNNG
jgi:hypothetical protein